MEVIRVPFSRECKYWERNVSTGKWTTSERSWRTGGPVAPARGCPQHRGAAWGAQTRCPAGALGPGPCLGPASAPSAPSLPPPCTRRKSSPVLSCSPGQTLPSCAPQQGDPGPSAVSPPWHSPLVSSLVVSWCLLTLPGFTANSLTVRSQTLSREGNSTVPDGRAVPRTTKRKAEGTIGSGAPRSSAPSHGRGLPGPLT